MIFPVEAPFTWGSRFGEPRPNGRTHQGVDLVAREGAELYACEDGVIGAVYIDPLGGNAVTLKGASGARYYYAHLSRFAVRGGDRVQAGEVVGYVGTTIGHRSGATIPHLHFELHPNGGAAVDPEPALRTATTRAPRAVAVPALGLAAAVVVGFALLLLRGKRGAPRR